MNKKDQVPDPESTILRPEYYSEELDGSTSAEEFPYNGKQTKCGSIGRISK